MDINVYKEKMEKSIANFERDRLEHGHIVHCSCDHWAFDDFCQRVQRRGEFY